MSVISGSGGKEKRNWMSLREQATRRVCDRALPPTRVVKLLFDLKLLLVLYRSFFEFSCACTGLTSHLNEPRIEP